MDMKAMNICLASCVAKHNHAFVTTDQGDIDDGIPVQSEKWIIFGTMLVATFVFGYLPLSIIQCASQGGGGRNRAKNLISLCSCFSGGVFMAACLLDLFPDVHEKWDSVLDEIEHTYHTKIDYPMANFVIVIGFFLVLLIEQLVLHCKENRTDYLEIDGSVDPDEHAPLINERSQRRHYSGASMDSEAGSLHAIADHEGHSHGHEDIFNHSMLRAVLLLIALSFHSLFEGLAIGLQQEKVQLISLFLAVILHKAVMAFSLGLNLAQADMSKRRFLLSILMFSVASPLGLAIGILMTDMPTSLPSDIANGVLQGISGGTFLYITFFEVLPAELNKKGRRMLKVAFVIIGYSCICVLLMIAH